MAAALTVIAPEWLFSLGDIIRYNFAAVVRTAYAATGDADLTSDIKSITVMRDGWKTGYLQHLVTPYNVQMAAALIASLPTLIVYILLGRYFMRGLMAGALKG